MHQTRHTNSPFLAALTLALLIAAWIMFAPLQFGGRAAYVIVNGNSMEPGFHRGDLVILHAAATSDYQIGDVATYRHPEIGPVIHRIIGREGDRFVFKGDHNGWVDSYHPTSQELIGKQWIYLPAVGTLVERLRAPWAMALLAAGMGVLAMVSITRDQPRQRVGRWRPPTIRFVIVPSAHQRGRSAARPSIQPAALQEGALFALATLTLASLLLALFAFVQPAYTNVPDDLGYEHMGTFTYSAAAPAGVYDGGNARTGDPLFRRLTSSVAVRFEYRLASDTPATLSGTYHLAADISDGEGWSRRITLQEERAFSGDRFSTDQTVDLAQVQKLIDSFERQTGVRRQQYTLAIVPTINVQGSLAGQAFRETFAPQIAFQLDPLELRPAKDGDSNPFQPAQKGLIKRSHVEPNSLNLLGLKLAVPLARWLALAGLVIGIAGLAGLGRHMLHATRSDASAGIRLRHGALLMDVQGLDRAAGDARVVETASIDDLAKLAERSGQMILHETRGRLHQYVVRSGDVIYRYRITIGELPASIDAQDATARASAPGESVVPS